MLPSCNSKFGNVDVCLYDFYSRYGLKGSSVVPCSFQPSGSVVTTTLDGEVDAMSFRHIKSARLNIEIKSWRRLLSSDHGTFE